jgi:RNA polymerase sigma factor (TIGR02999 family)
MIMDKGDVSRILECVGAGEPGAMDRLLTLVHDELKRIAAARMRNERADHPLQTTALVNEAWLRLVGQDGRLDFANRRHFFGAAALAMRRILVDEARRRSREQNAAGTRLHELPDLAAKMTDPKLLELDEALTRLAEEDPVAARIVDLMVFAGMGRGDIAQALEVTVHEVRKKWTYARAWLRLEIGGEE